MYECPTVVGTLGRKQNPADRVVVWLRLSDSSLFIRNNQIIDLESVAAHKEHMQHNTVHDSRHLGVLVPYLADTPSCYQNLIHQSATYKTGINKWQYNRYVGDPNTTETLANLNEYVLQTI